MPQSVPLEDDIVPAAGGGAAALDNLALACVCC